MLYIFCSKTHINRGLHENQTHPEHHFNKHKNVEQVLLITVKQTSLREKVGGNVIQIWPYVWHLSVKFHIFTLAQNDANMFLISFVV